MRTAYIECQAGASGDMFLGAWLDVGVDENEWRRFIGMLNLDGVDISIHSVFKQGIRGKKVDVRTDGELYPDVAAHDHHHGHDHGDHQHHHEHEHPHEGEHEHEHEHHEGDEHGDHHHPDHDEHEHEHHHEHDHDHGHDHGDEHHEHHEHHEHDHGDHGDHQHHHAHPHRGLREIEAILDASHLPEIVRAKSKQAFRHLAEAEGAVHGLPPEQVHFHEVGALDAIVDIVGAMAGWYLAGMPVCYVSPIEVGGGTVRCAHGRMPVPAPATAILLQGFPTYSSGTWGETVTPTGAAILKTLCKTEPRPMMQFRAIGYGAGTKELPVANLLRIQLGEMPQGEVVFSGSPSGDQASSRPPVGTPTVGTLASGDPVFANSTSGQKVFGESTEVVQQGPSTSSGSGSSKITRGTYHETARVLEANIDDMSPEWIGYAVTRLLDEGASDVWATPVVMKKGRPGHVIHVLCTNENLARMERLLFEETTTIGVRSYEVTRRVLERRVIPVSTVYGEVRVKIAYDNGRILNIAPEYEDCRHLAVNCGVALKDVYQAVYETFPDLRSHMSVQEGFAWPG